MKKMNNKGFAISTVIYGLSIMGVLIISILMGTMSSTRSNNRKISKSIEDELTRYSKTDTSFAASTTDQPTAQEYIVPPGQSGWYLIELWGAQGGSAGGYGAYTSGVIHLQEGDLLYFYVGKKRNGKSGLSTDVRLEPGNYDNNDFASARSYETRIMVAAGGGSSAGAAGGTLYGYTSNMMPLGGRVRSETATGITDDFELMTTSQQSATNGTLAGYPKNYNKSSGLAQSGTPKPHQVGSTGGDGYFSSSNATQGGVSFISGYAGSKAYIKGSLTNKPKYTYYEYVYDDNNVGGYSDEGRDYYFLDGKMLAGVNAGDGKAKISRVVEESDSVKSLPRKNKKMENVTKVKDCLLNTNSNIAWPKFSVMKDGDDLAIDKTLTPSAKSESGSDYTCREINLGTPTNIDEIAVWHQDGVDYKQHTIEVFQNGTWKYVKGPGKRSQLSETESVTGYRVSAYQVDYTQELPSVGDYYIIPVLTENKTLTAQSSAEVESNEIKVERINGQKRQAWSIEYIDEALRNARNSSTTEYKIVELARYKSLEIYQDENIVGNKVKADTRFNAYGSDSPTGSKGHDPEIWNIFPEGNGTYIISTVVPKFYPAINSGYLYAQEVTPTGAASSKVLIGKNVANTMRFKIVSISY